MSIVLLRYSAAEIPPSGKPIRVVLCCGLLHRVHFILPITAQDVLRGLGIIHRKKIRLVVAPASF